MSALALRGRVVLPGKLLEDGVVAVAGERIEYAGPASGWSGPAEPVELVIPGLVDVHCHGGGGHCFDSADPAEIAAAAEHHRRRGTTTMLASLVSAPPERLLAQVGAFADLLAGTVAGVHLEGPWLGRGHCGAHDPAALSAPTAAQARELLAAGPVRMVTLAPELPGADEVARLLEEAGVLAAYGHTDADAQGFARALAERRTPHVTHLFNGMAPMHHRTPGPVASALLMLAQGRGTVELIADGLHLADETVRMVFAIRADAVCLVSDAMAAAGLGDGDHRLGGLAVEVRGGRALTTGPVPSLAGSTAHLGDVLARTLAAGVDLVAAVDAATRTPAALLGLADRGSLAPGLRADLAVLDGTTITRVLSGGVWVR